MTSRHLKHAMVCHVLLFPALHSRYTCTAVFWLFQHSRQFLTPASVQPILAPAVKGDLHAQCQERFEACQGGIR